MRKQVETIFCDDCKRHCAENQIDIIYLGRIRHDICRDCMQLRLRHSFSILKLGEINCDHCGGKGTIKEGYGHNDYELVKCPVCGGKKRKLT